MRKATLGTYDTIAAATLTVETQTAVSSSNHDRRGSTFLQPPKAPDTVAIAT